MPTSLLNERFRKNDGQGNCLEYAAREARHGRDELVFLEDTVNGDANDAGHVLVRDKQTGRVWDPNGKDLHAPADSQHWQFDSLGTWKDQQRVAFGGEQPYSELGSVDAEVVHDVLKRPVGEEREQVVARSDDRDLKRVADRSFADPPGPVHMAERELLLREPESHWQPGEKPYVGQWPDGFEPRAYDPDKAGPKEVWHVGPDGDLVPVDAAGPIHESLAPGQRRFDGYIRPKIGIEEKFPHAREVSSTVLAADAAYKQDVLNDPSEVLSFVAMDRDGFTSVKYDEVDPAGLGITAPSFNKGSNFQAGIFKNRDADEYIVAFKGTNSWEDWTRGNIPQGAGLDATNYKLARNFAKQVGSSAVAGLTDATFTGHSEGGGMATVAHIVTGNPTFAYNPADLARNNIVKARKDALPTSQYHGIEPTWFHDWGGVHAVVSKSTEPASGLTSIVTENDVLDRHVNRLAGGYNDMGDKYIVKTDPDLKPYPPKYDLSNWGVKAHLLNNMIKGLANAFQASIYPNQEPPNWGQPRNDPPGVLY